ncbi:MAG: rhodanese-like domain-containing protein [Gammaproteobacteria bacterium]|nr:rhodanese-like domain-containing protein [Gammaproteobacteria bacterium]
MSIAIKISGAVMLLSTVYNTHAKEEGFPGRLEFPGIPTMEIAELNKQLNQVVVVDTRSQLEYETLQIKGALNLSIADKTFGDKIQALRLKTDKPLVFYCNGRDCHKSYLAVKEAQRRHIENTFAYDAGMFDWAKAYPEHTVLLGKNPINPQDILSEAQFERHLLDSDSFTQQAFDLGSKSIIIDVRDKYQRAGAGVFATKERWITLDDREKLQQVFAQAVKDKRTLFIYDEVGKQVQWLQYAIERAGLKDYFFMKHGAKAYFTKMMKESGFNLSLAGAKLH